MARILLIEDDIDILEVLTWILTEDGHKVLSFSKMMPVEEIKAFKPNIILLDEWLQDSIERSKWCQSLKANLRDAVILILTLSLNTLNHQTTLESGADGYIQKPFDIDELCSNVNTYLV
jgi:DNA-binding response OmpR family regulator